MLIAVDTGGTKTLVAGFLEDGKIGQTIKFPTPKDEAEYLDLLVPTIKTIAADRDIDSIVIGLPGRISKTQILSKARNLGWEDFDIRKALSHHFEAPIIIENDANLAGLAEARQRRTTPDVCLYITISTGIGTGIILEGKIDPHYRQSEGGQMILEHDGILRRWESFSSGKAIYATYGKYGSEIKSKRIWKQIANNISKGILVLSPILRPDIIIIGGSMGSYFAEYEEYLLGYLKEQLHYVPQIIAAKHPEQAVIYGCYYYALDYFATV